MTFPELSFPPAAVYDTAKVRLGDGFVSARFPSTSRRALLASAPALALAGCAGFSVSQTSADISMIAKGVKAILPLILAVTGIGSPIYTAIVAIVDEIESLATSNTTAVGTTVWSNVGAALRKIVSLITGIKVPVWVNTILSAAVKLVSSYLPTMAAGVPVGMTLKQARDILQSAANP